MSLHRFNNLVAINTKNCIVTEILIAQKTNSQGKIEEIVFLTYSLIPIKFLLKKLA